MPTPVPEIVALQALGPSLYKSVYLTAVGREGIFNIRTGTAPSDPLQGIYVVSNTTGYYWERDWDGTNGRPEWFGAVAGDPTQAAANDAALPACHALCQTMRMSAGIYWTSVLLTLARSSTNVLGAGVSSDGTLGTTIMLTGAHSVGTTVLQVGTGDATNPSRWQVVAGINVGRDNSTTAPNPSTNNNPINCVKGVVFSGTTNSIIHDCRVIDSPIGFFITGTSACGVHDCNVQRTTPASSATNDFYVAYLIGGYSTNYGFVGANGSLLLERNTAFGTNPAFVSATQYRLFGYCADTFIGRTPEGSLMAYGIEIDGRDASGTVITTGGAAQDIIIEHPVMDGFSNTGIYVHDGGITADIQIIDPYGASNGTGIAGNNWGGSLLVSGGDLLGSNAQIGITLNGVGAASVIGTLLRDFGQPVILNTLTGFDIQPKIFNPTSAASEAVNAVSCQHGLIAPIINGAATRFGVGVALDSACANMEVNGSKIVTASLNPATQSQKVQFNGQDASTGAGATAFTGAGNVLTGVLG